VRRASDLRTNRISDIGLLVNFKPLGAGKIGGVACELDLVFPRRTPSWRILAVPSNTLPTAFGPNHFIIPNRRVRELGPITSSVIRRLSTGTIEYPSRLIFARAINEPSYLIARQAFLLLT
jgi:hypothetical protein